MIHQAFVINALSDNDNRLPQEITSSGSPMPIKLNVDSVTMAERIFITTINMIAEIKFGPRCRMRIWKNDPPIHFEATMYSLLRSCRTSVRTTFAILHQLVIPMTKAIDKVVGSPKTAWIKITSRMDGIVKTISAPRIMIVSTMSEANPLTDP